MEKITIVEEEKTIYNLKLHETLFLVEKTSEGAEKKIEVTRVPGGWIYAFEFPGFRQAPTMFVPFNNEFMIFPKTKK